MERWLPISDSLSSLFRDLLKPLTVIVVVIVLILVGSDLIGGQFSSLRFSSRGRVKVYGVGVYWDVGCSNAVYSLDWGGLEPGSVKNVSVFIRNEGNEPSTLFLNVTGWSPANASDFMALTWSYKGYVVYPQQTIKVTLMLSVASVTEGINDFSFEIIIGVK